MRQISFSGFLSKTISSYTNGSSQNRIDTLATSTSFQKKDTRSKLKAIASFCIMLVTLLGSSFSISEATIVPASTFTEVSIAIPTITDAVINCDMLQDPNSQVIKAIVWSDGQNSGGTSTPGLYVEDYLGSTATIALPPGAEQADVALANTLPNPSGAIVYQAAVA